MVNRIANHFPEHPLKEKFDVWIRSKDTSRTITYFFRGTKDQINKMLLRHAEENRMNPNTETYHYVFSPSNAGRAKVLEAIATDADNPDLSFDQRDVDDLSPRIGTTTR
ncbi:MAG: hypothetical protein ABL890_02755 [Candidatus Peribacteraceae bacterium]